MSNKYAFTRNYNDLSTNHGFQFEFTCDRCGAGFRSHFEASVTGAVTGMLDVAGSMLGGIFHGAARLGDQARDATWSKARDSAFEKAIQEIRPDFIQCPRCTSWVCRQSCWNTKRGLCKECAPDLGVEMSAAQASKSVEEIWANAAMAEEDKKLATEHWRETIVASCPNCETPFGNNAKFCPGCGQPIKRALHCSQCGAKQTPGGKFCSDCGAKL